MSVTVFQVAIVNHLWQSTLFTVAAALLALCLRHHRATVRFWVWQAASVKFLVPFASLAAMGARLPLGVRGTAPESALLLVWTTTLVPLSQPLPIVNAPDGSLARLSVSVVFGAIWLAGCLIVLGVSVARWWRAARIAAAGRPTVLASTLAHGSRVRIIETPRVAAPAVFGIRRPVLLWPAGLERELEPAEVDAIVCHETSHIERADNLSACVHLIVEAVFWFHPLVWWIGARLIHERERACDEAVALTGTTPEVYVEGILKVCERFGRRQFWGLAGITDSPLTARIDAIMRNRIGRPLGSWGRRALATLALLTIAAPVAIGAASSPAPWDAVMSPQSPASAVFDVVSVKENHSTDNRQTIGGPPGRFIGRNVTLLDLVATAYNVMEPGRLSGGPAWSNSDKFDIEATAPADRNWNALLLQRLQAFLADRFELKLAREMRTVDVWSLVRAGTGSALKPAAGGECLPPPQGICGGFHTGPGLITGRRVTLGQLARLLSSRTGRQVIDHTQLTGTYDVELTWTPDLDRRDPAAPATQDNTGSIFTAIREQLGLRLESARAEVEHLTIVSAARPRPD
ncbi:MAG TPA: M56 family metallopeptidase [Vicinamibacterales bacterium]|nr:M56 family metallopeptidase [Vicinamibacterales bacterium]